MVASINIAAQQNIAAFIGGCYRHDRCVP